MCRAFILFSNLNHFNVFIVSLGLNISYYNFNFKLCKFIFLMFKENIMLYMCILSILSILILGRAKMVKKKKKNPLH